MKEKRDEEKRRIVEEIEKGDKEKDGEKVRRLMEKIIEEIERLLE